MKGISAPNCKAICAISGSSVETMILSKQPLAFSSFNRPGNHGFATEVFDVLAGDVLPPRAGDNGHPGHLLPAPRPRLRPATPLPHPVAHLAAPETSAS